MKCPSLSAIIIAALSITACETESAIGADSVVPTPYLPITLSVQGDNQGSLPQFALSDNPQRYRAYLQAVPDERYSLRIVNNSSQRVGLVIAVDGRNIISGKKSWLAHNEKMYVLNPQESATYEGWRTGKDKTNRFYFTQVQNSYAAAWGDKSAMGVIAMAAYPEVMRPVVNEEQSVSKPATRSVISPSADAAAPAGTGFGETHYSPTTLVAFEPVSEPMERVVLKYEWRETLCRKKILPECAQAETEPNRLWDDNQGYAPPPPRYPQ